MPARSFETVALLDELREQGRQGISGERPRPASGGAQSAPAGEAATSNTWRSFALTRFRDFCAELLEVRDIVTIDPALLVEVADRSSAVSPSQAARAVNQRLVAYIDQMGQDASRLGGEALARDFRDVQDLMAVLGDEVLLNVEWTGRDIWPTYLLEYKLFQTFNGGERFFTRLDRLLAEREGSNPELSLIFLYALALGFQGRYRGTAQVKALADYRARLYAFVHRGAPTLGDNDRTLFPQALQHTLAGREVAPLPLVTRWLIILSTTAVVVLLAGQVLWWRSTTDLRELTTRISNISADQRGAPKK